MRGLHQGVLTGSVRGHLACLVLDRPNPRPPGTATSSGKRTTTPLSIDSAATPLPHKYHQQSQHTGIPLWEFCEFMNNPLLLSTLSGGMLLRPLVKPYRVRTLTVPNPWCDLVFHSDPRGGPPIIHACMLATLPDAPCSSVFENTDRCSRWSMF